MSQQAQIPKPVLISRIRLPSNLLKILRIYTLFSFIFSSIIYVCFFFFFIAANTQEINQLLKKTETNLDCIGFGTNHCFSKFHLELKAQLCEKWFNNLELTDDLMSSLSGNLEISNKMYIFASNFFISKS